MRSSVPIPSQSAERLKREKETGIGYQIVAVKLKNGRCFDQVIASEGCLIQVRGYEVIPFGPEEVTSVSINHKRWNFRDVSRARTKNLAASA